MTIRDLTPSDAEAAAALTPNWTVADYQAITRGDFPDRVCLVAIDKGLAGLILTSCVPPDAEILNVFVAPASRRRGVAHALLNTAKARLAASGAHRVWLEVRESNAAALHLYGAAGFRQVARRSKYYRSPNEDALVLETALTVC